MKILKLSQLQFAPPGSHLHCRWHLIKKSSRAHFADSTVLLGMGSVNNQQYSNASHCWFKTPPHPTISVPTTAPSLLFALRLILAPEMPFLFLSRDLCIVNCADSNGQMFGFPPTGWNISVFTAALICIKTFNWICFKFKIMVFQFPLLCPEGLNILPNWWIFV